MLLSTSYVSDELMAPKIARVLSYPKSPTRSIRIEPVRKEKPRISRIARMIRGEEGLESSLIKGEP